MVYEQCREGLKKVLSVLSLCSGSSPPLLCGTQSSPHHSQTQEASRRMGKQDIGLHEIILK